MTQGWRAVLKDFKLYGILAFIAALINLAVFKSGPFWDDHVFIFSTQGVISAPDPWVFWFSDSGFKRVWALGYSQFWVLFKLFGPNFWGYKLVTMLFHAGNSFLLIKLGQRLNIRYAIFAGFIFLLHPLHVETLSWIFQLNSVAGLFWGLLALLYLLKQIELIKEGGETKKLVIGFLLFVLFYTISILIKPVAVLVPFCALLTIDYSLLRKHLLKIILLIVILLIMGFLISYLSNDAITRSVYENSIRKTYFFDELFGRIAFGPSVTSIEGDLAYHTFWGKVALKIHLMSRNFMFYTLKFFVPYRLLFIYPKWSLLSSDAVLMVVGSILIGISYVWALFSSKWRPKLVPISIAVAGFLPVSGLIYIPYMKYSYVADHWAYVMVAGMALGLSQIFSIFQNHLPKNTSKVFLIVFIMMLAAVQSNYARVFNNTTEMLERNIKYSPDSPFPYQYLARLYLQNNNFYEATRVIERGLKAAPNDEQLLKLKEEASSID